MINERVQISLKPKGRACFIDVSAITEDQSDYKRVQIKEADLGRKLGYTEMLDVISYSIWHNPAWEPRWLQHPSNPSSYQQPLRPLQKLLKLWLNPRDLGASPKHLQRLQPHEYIASHF